MYKISAFFNPSVNCIDLDPRLVELRNLIQQSTFVIYMKGTEGAYSAGTADFIKLGRFLKLSETDLVHKLVDGGTPVRAWEQAKLADAFVIQTLGYGSESLLVSMLELVPLKNKEFTPVFFYRTKFEIHLVQAVHDMDMRVALGPAPLLNQVRPIEGVTYVPLPPGVSMAVAKSWKEGSPHEVLDGWLVSSGLKKSEMAVFFGSLENLGSKGLKVEERYQSINRYPFRYTVVARPSCTPTEFLCQSVNARVWLSNLEGNVSVTPLDIR